MEAGELIGEFGEEPGLQLLLPFVLGTISAEDLCTGSPSSKGEGDSFPATLVTEWVIYPILGFSIRKPIITLRPSHTLQNQSYQ